MKTVRIFWKNGKTTEIDVFSLKECDTFWYLETFNGDVRVPLALIDGWEIEE